MDPTFKFAWERESDEDLFFCIFEVGGDQIMGGLFLNEVPDFTRNINKPGDPRTRCDCVASWNITAKTGDKDVVPFLSAWQLQGAYGWVDQEQVLQTLKENNLRPPFGRCDTWDQMRVERLVDNDV